MKAFLGEPFSESSEEFQTTTSMKSLDSVLEQLYCGLVYCLHVVLFVRQGYMDFQEPGNNCGLLHSCGRMCTTEPHISSR